MDFTLKSWLRYRLLATFRFRSVPFYLCIVLLTLHWVYFDRLCSVHFLFIWSGFFCFYLGKVLTVILILVAIRKFARVVLNSPYESRTCQNWSKIVQAWQSWLKFGKLGALKVRNFDLGYNGVPASRKDLIFFYFAVH